MSYFCVIVRLTKIMNNLVKGFKILIFKVIFQLGKFVKSILMKLIRFLKAVLNFLKMFPISIGSVHNFQGRHGR